jgi:hypothetical protein
VQAVSEFHHWIIHILSVNSTTGSFTTCLLIPPLDHSLTDDKARERLKQVHILSERMANNRIQHYSTAHTTSRLNNSVVDPDPDPYPDPNWIRIQ